MVARLLNKVFPFLALAALAGCEEQEIAPITIVHPTLVEVSPDDFLDGVPCQVGQGSMQTYVATLHDFGPVQYVADENGVLQVNLGPDLPEVGFARRSDPVACNAAVGFAQVTPENLYSVDIQAFDRADLVVHEPGVEVTFDAPPPDVRDATTLEVVAPRWTTLCGEPKIIARTAIVRRVRNCAPLLDSQPTTVSGVELRPDLALGSVKCGSGAGRVDHFEVTTATGTETVACGDALTIADATVGRTLVLDVLAFEAGEADALLGTTCTAVPTSGVTVTGTCSPFTDKGALEVDPAEAALALGVSCDTLRELTLTAPGAPPVRVRPNGCGSLVPVVGLPRGTQEVAVAATPADGSAVVTGTCSAAVVPGRRVLASCALSP